MFHADPAAFVQRDLRVDSILRGPVTTPMTQPLSPFRHPICLAIGLCHALTFALLWRGLVAPIPLRELAGLFLLALGLAALAIVGFLAMRQRLSRGSQGVTLHLTPVAALIVGLSLWFGGLYTQMTGAELPRDLGLLALLLWLAAETWLALFVTMGLPRAPADGVPSSDTTSAAGADRFSLMDLVMMQSDGKHVVLTTTKGRARVAGPLSSLINGLPEGSGAMIHRSLWVASHAVLGHHRQGRRLMIDLLDGQRVEVALSRQSKVLAWLRALAAQGFAQWPRQGKSAVTLRKDRPAPRPWARQNQDGATP